MDPEFWHHRWEQGEIGWHKTEINLHLSRHWPSLALDAGSRVLVPLCGKSLDLLWLAGEGHRVVGVELSQIAVAQFFAEQGLQPTITAQGPFQRYQVDELEILCGDFYALTPALLGPIDAVYDRASLIAMPPERRPAYAAQLTRLTAGAVRMLLICMDYPQDEMAGPPFSVPEAEVRTLYREHFEIQSLAVVDIWAENPRFRERGMTRLDEHVLALHRLPTAKAPT